MFISLVASPDFTSPVEKCQPATQSTDNQRVAVTQQPPSMPGPDQTINALAAQLGGVIGSSVQTDLLTAVVKLLQGQPVGTCVVKLTTRCCDIDTLHICANSQ